MKNMRKWMLGAAVVAAGLGLGATTAQAAEYGVYVRGPLGHVSDRPSYGYARVGDRWNYEGYGDGDRYVRVKGRRDFDRDAYARRDMERRDFDRRDSDRRDFDRRDDRGRDRGWDRR